MALVTGYALDGTANANLTTGSSGFALLGGTAPKWDATGLAMEVVDGGTTTASYGEDQSATGDWSAFVFSILATPTAADMCIYNTLNTATSLAAIRVRSTGFVSIYSGLGTLAATGTTTISVGTKYRIEHQCNASGQTLKLYAETGSTPLDTLSGGVASALAVNKRRIGHPQTAQASQGADFWSYGVYDAEPLLGASDPWTYSKLARFGT